MSGFYEWDVSPNAGAYLASTTGGPKIEIADDAEAVIVNALPTLTIFDTLRSEPIGERFRVEPSEYYQMRRNPLTMSMEFLRRFRYCGKDETGWPIVERIAQ